MTFNEKTLDFLFENKIHDSKAWFLENKPVYEQHVLRPMCDMVLSLAETMNSIDPQIICEPKINKSISRIYRDTRFSKDKSVFRDVMWCMFLRGGKSTSGQPGYFIEFSPRGFRYGCGYYSASADAMDAVRMLIINGDSSFKRVEKCLKKQDIFELTGDKYKRSKYSEYPDNIRNWLDRKNVGLIHESTDFDLLFSDEFAGKLAQDFMSLKPVYDFFMKAQSMIIK